MAMIRSKDQLANWLGDKSREVGLMIAARAALRVMPLSSEQIDTNRILAIFHALAASWLIARNPDLNLDNELSAAKLDLDYRHWGNEFISSTSYLGAAYLAVKNALAASEDYHAGSVVDAAYSVDAAWSSVSEDCEAIEAGADPASLAARPLWLSRKSDWSVELWNDLKRKLLTRNEHWEVWTDWYEAKLRGDASDEQIEMARVREIKNNEWERGPLVVNARIKEIITKHSRSKIEPVEGVSSAVDFGWTKSAGRMRAFPSDDFKPDFHRPGDKRDHKPRLDLCRKLGNDLIDAVNDGRFNTRPDDYRAMLEGYVDNLPRSVRKQNILEADHYARCLRSMFANEAAILPLPIGALLKSFLETHQSLRVFYPGLHRFYDAVRLGRIEDPLPIDAFSAVGRIVEETSTLFDYSVGETFGGLARNPPPAPAEPFPEPN